MNQGVKGIAARAFVAGAAVALLGAASAVAAAAQVRGLPLYNAGVARGIAIGAEVGFPNADAGKGRAFGVSGSAGLGLIGVTATVASYDPAGSVGGDLAVGGTLNYRMLGGPLIPLAVTLQGGVGYYKADDGVNELTETHIPIGVGFALTIPNPALAIKPWLAPRVDITRRTVTTTEGLDVVIGTNTETSFGLSGGLEFNAINGLGVRAGYDLVTSGPGTPGVFGIGVHYALRIPVP